MPCPRITSPSWFSREAFPILSPMFCATVREHCLPGLSKPRLRPSCLKAYVRRSKKRLALRRLVPEVHGSEHHNKSQKIDLTLRKLSFARNAIQPYRAFVLISSSHWLNWLKLQVIQHQRTER